MERHIYNKSFIKLFIDTREEPSTLLELGRYPEVLTYEYIYKLIETEFQLESEKFELHYFCPKNKRIVKLETTFVTPVKDLADNRLEVILLSKHFRPTAMKKQLFLQKLDQAQNLINSLFQSTSGSQRHLLAMDRHQSSVVGDSSLPWNYQAPYLTPLNYNSYEMFPSIRRFDSLNVSNNVATNIINSKVINNIGYPRLPNEYEPHTSFHAPSYYQQNNDVIPINETREKNSSISAHKEVPVAKNTYPSYSNGSSSNPKYSMIGLGSKSKNGKRTRKRKMGNPDANRGHGELVSSHSVPPINLIYEDENTKLSMHQSHSEVEMSNRIIQGENENNVADIPPLDRTLTSRTHDSLSCNRHPSLKKGDSTAFIKRSVIEQSEGESITIVGLFSEPLVYIRRKGRDVKEPEEYRPVDFEGEISDIAEVAQSKGHEKITFKVGSLNMDNFRKTIESSPEIIHIMCHGDFDKEYKRYFLDFENEDAEVFPFYRDNIEKFLDEKSLNNTILVFLNACYSEQIIDSFLNRNIKCVVAIDKFSKIDDRVSKDFARVFYRYLLSDTTLQKAFDNTVTDLSITYSRNQESYFTFCAHVHKEDCKWNEKEHSDLLHVMLTCDCPNKFRNLHRVRCLAVIHYQLEIWTETNNEGLNLDEKEVLLCCCSPEIPHEEILKFKIFFSDDRFKQMTLADINLKAQTTYRKTQFRDFDDWHIEKKFANVSSVGFNFYIYQLFNYFVNQSGRIGFVYGEYGSGKTTLVKHFANYCYHRNKFKFIFYRDFARIHAIEELVSKIRQRLNGGSQQTRLGPDNRRMRKTTKRLFILDNMDVLIDKNAERVKREIESFIQNEDLYFLITLSKSKSVNFLLESKEVILKPLSYYVGAQLFLNKCRLNLPSAYQNFNSLIYYEDFEKIQALMVFYPFNLISLATRISTVEFDLEGMKTLIDMINKRYEIEETSELTTQQNIRIEDDLFQYKFLTFLGLLEQGAYFLEDLGSYAFQNTFYEARSLIKFMLDEVIDTQHLSDRSMEEYGRICLLKFTDQNHVREIYIDVFESLRNLIIESRLKSSQRIEVRTLSLELLTYQENETLLIVKTFEIRKHLRNNFTRRVFNELVAVFNFLIQKANCLVSYFQSNYLVVEDTYFTAFRQFEFAPFFLDQPLKNSVYRKRRLTNFIRTHLLNMKSIIDDNVLVSRYLNHVRLDESSAANSLWIFELFIIKFFSVAEMESLNESYFDIEIDFKNLICIIKMDETLSDSLNKLYLQLCLFSLNSMLKRTFLQKYSHDYYNRITSRISLIKSIFRESYLKNNEEQFRIYKLEFYYLKIRAYKKLAKGKRRYQNSKSLKPDKRPLKLLAKLEAAIQSLDLSQHRHFLCKVYLMLVKHKYHSNNLDLNYVVNLEYCFGTLNEISNLNLSLRVHLALCVIYNDWNNRVFRDLHLQKAQEINERVQSIIYETRVNRIASALHSNSLIAKSQFAFAVASYYRHTEFDFSQIEVIGLDTFKEPFLSIMEDQANCHANFMFEPLNRSTLRKLLQVEMHYKVLCLYFNSIHRSAFYFDASTETLEYDAVSPKELLSLLKERKAQIEILVLLNPIADREVLNQICLEIPYTIYIEKFELASIATPDAEKKIANFCVLNLLKQFVSRLIYEGQHNVLEVFQSSVEVVYNCLEAFISQYIVSSEEKQPSESEAEQSFEESLANVVKSNLKFKLLWNNETPFFEKLFEAIDQTSCVISINSSDDFGTIFRLNDQKRYPMTEGAPLQKRLYKNCEGFTSSSQLIEWLFKTLDMYNRQRKKSRGKKAKESTACEMPVVTLDTLILFGVHFVIDPFISENLAKLIIRLRITIVIFNSTELFLRSPYVIDEKQIKLPKQDFNLMIFDYSSEENVKSAELVLRQLIKLITESVFLPANEEDSDLYSDAAMKRIALGKRISFENPDNAEAA